MSHQKNPCYRSLMKIHQHGAEIFNKLYTFEVSIGMFHSVWSCLIKRIPVIEVSWKSISMESEIFNKMWSFEVSIGLFHHFDCLIKRIPVMSHENHVNIELRYVTNCALLEVSIGLLCLILIHLIKWIPVIEVS